MRPIELIIEGFTSFRTRQVLDFSSLDLFAITGATGAGKTSLLDAITFALYDRVAQKPNSSRELVSQGATQLKIELRFEMRQKQYRALRTWRNRGKTDIKNFLLEELIDDVWDRCATQKVEEIIGMDFETFTRVIILPQGQFDEFLKGEASKRREILRQLAGFQIFEQMRKEASDRTSRFKAEREGLELVLEGMQAPTIDDVEAKQKELEQLEVSIPELDIKTKQNRKILDAEERLLSQIQQYKQLSIQIGTLQQDADQIQILKTKLHSAQAAHAIAGNWKILQTTRQRVQTAIASLTNAKQKLANDQTNLEQQQQILKQVQTESLATQALIAEQERKLAIAESLHQQQQQSEAELNRAEQNLQARSQAFSKLEKDTKLAETAFQNATQALQKIELAIANSPRDVSRLEKLHQVSAALSQWQILQNNFAKQQQKLEQIKNEVNQLTNQLAISQPAIANAESEVTQLNLDIAAAEASNFQALQSSHAHALRTELHDGDLCPVCNNHYVIVGLPELPAIKLIEIKTLQQQRELKVNQLASLREDRIKVETNLGTSQLQLQAQSQESTDLEHQVQSWQLQIDQILQTPWTADAIIRDRQALEIQEQAHQKLAQESSASIINLQNAETKLNTIRENLQLAELEMQKATHERELRQSQLQGIMQQLQAITAGKSYEILQRETLAQKVELSDRLESVAIAHQQARENLIKSESATMTAQQEHDQAIADCDQLELNWQLELSNLNISEAEFLAAQTSRSQIEAWQQEITTYQRQVQELTTRLQVITEAIADQHTDEQAILTLRETLNQLEQELQLANESRAAIKAWLEQAHQKCQESQAIEERKLALQSQELTYHTLAQDLQSNKFQEYILDSLQQELASRASVLLQQLSEDRYTLQIESGDYWVSDNWNGGEKRRVRTLSGGETFAASLSMALALSERLSMGIELGSLFLDEGFGTLDSETLESVTQILESLRQQDRMIGVITHIQSLADRLPTQIHVRKSPTGSELVTA
ncbi:SMC family ATPase [Pseudanabaena biceps]|nr:SMC family ATPase [Pseudanabaena biceps]